MMKYFCSTCKAFYTTAHMT